MSEWIEYTDDNGNLYYQNSITGENSWTRPGGEWLEKVNENGEKFFVNSETGEQKWELDTVELEQQLKNEVDSLGLGTMKLALEGKLRKMDADVSKKLHNARKMQRDLVKQRDAEIMEGQELWVEVYDPGEDAFYYYGSYTGETTWDKPANYVMAADDELMGAVIKIQCAYRNRLAKRKADQEKERQSQSIDALSNTKPCDKWYAQVQDGTVFYYNTLTGECVSEKPADFIEKQDDTAPVTIMKAMSTAIKKKIRRLDAEVQQKLDEARKQQNLIEEQRKKDEMEGKEVWVEVYDPVSDSFYYYGTITGETQWEPPPSYVMAADDDLMTAVIKIQCAYRSKLARKTCSRRRSIQSGNAVDEHLETKAVLKKPVDEASTIKDPKESSAKSDEVLSEHQQGNHEITEGNIDLSKVIPSEASSAKPSSSIDRSLSPKEPNEKQGTPVVQQLSDSVKSGSTIDHSLSSKEPIEYQCTSVVQQKSDSVEPSHPSLESNEKQVTPAVQQNSDPGGGNEELAAKLKPDCAEKKSFKQGSEFNCEDAQSTPTAVVENIDFSKNIPVEVDSAEDCSKNADTLSPKEPSKDKVAFDLHQQSECEEKGEELRPRSCNGSSIAANAPLEVNPKSSKPSLEKKNASNSQNKGSGIQKKKLEKRHSFMEREKNTKLQYTERRKMLEEEKIQCSFGDRFWGIDLTNREIKRQILEESLMKQAEELRRALMAKAKRREEIDRKMNEELQKRMLVEDAASEQSERDAMSSQEQAQCQIDIFWGIQKEENDRVRSLASMQMEDNLSFQYARALFEHHLHKRWADEEAHSLEVEQKKKNINEKIFQKQYMKLFRSCRSSDEVIDYTWPTYRCKDRTFFDRKQSNPRSTKHSFSLEFVYNSQKVNCAKYTFHASGCAHSAGRNGKLDISTLKKKYKIESRREYAASPPKSWTNKSNQFDPRRPARYNGIDYDSSKVHPCEDILSAKHKKKNVLPSLQKRKNTLKESEVPTNNQNETQYDNANNETIENDWTNYSAERDLLYKLFMMIDLDNSGFIDKEEMVWALTRDEEICLLANRSIVLQPLIKKKNIDLIFSDMDNDDSDNITWNEFDKYCEDAFNAWVESEKLKPKVEIVSQEVLIQRKKDLDEKRAQTVKQEEDTARKVFELVDVDKSGTIDQKEMMVALETNEKVREFAASSKALRPLLTESTFAEAFMKMDTDDEDGISLEEFVAFCSEVASVALLNFMVEA